MFTENCVLSPAVAEKMSQDHRVRQKQWNTLSCLVYSSSPRPAAPSESRSLYNHSPLVPCFPLPLTVSCPLHSSLKTDEALEHNAGVWYPLFTGPTEASPFTSQPSVREPGFLSSLSSNIVRKDLNTILPSSVWQTNLMIGFLFS